MSTDQLRSELVAALSSFRAPVPVSTLRRRITSTRHECRIGAALRGLERDGVARFTREGSWELVPGGEAGGPGHNDCRAAPQRSASRAVLEE